MKRPFFWKARKAWYIKNDKGQKVKLHADKEKAHAIWQELRAIANPESSEAQVCAIVELFLVWCENNIARSTLYQYGHYLVKFCSHEDMGLYLVRDLKQYHAQTWLDKNAKWKSETKRTAITALKRCFSWAVEQGYLTKNPFERMKRPGKVPRSRLITEKEHRAIMLARDSNGSKYGKAKGRGGRDGCFRAFLIALRHSGARPGSIATVRKEDVSEDGQRWVLEDHKTRHKTGKPLTIYLSPCLQTLTRIFAEERASGPLFLNSKGKPWTNNAIRQRMGELKARLKIKGKFVAYAYRHTYATTALTSGTDLATVAELLGHTSTDMVMRVYGHLNQKKQYLVDAAAKVHRKGQ